MPGKKVKIGYTITVVKLQNLPIELGGDAVTVHWKKRSKASARAGAIAKKKETAGHTVPVLVSSSSVIFDAQQDNNSFSLDTHVVKDMKTSKLSPKKLVTFAVQVERLEKVAGFLEDKNVAKMKKAKKEKKEKKSSSTKSRAGKVKLGQIELNLNDYAQDGEIYQLGPVDLTDVPSEYSGKDVLAPRIFVTVETRWKKFDGMRCVMATPVIEDTGKMAEASAESKREAAMRAKKKGHRKSVVGAQWKNLLTNVSHLTKDASTEDLSENEDRSSDAAATSKQVEVNGMMYDLAETSTEVSVDDTTFMDLTSSMSEMDFTADNLSDDENESGIEPASFEDDDADEPLPPLPPSDDESPAPLPGSSLDLEESPSSSQSRGHAAAKKLRRLSVRLKDNNISKRLSMRVKPGPAALCFLVDLVEARGLTAEDVGSDVFVSWRRGAKGDNSGKSEVATCKTVEGGVVAVWPRQLGDKTFSVTAQMEMDPKTQKYEEKNMVIQLRKKKKKSGSAAAGKSSGGRSIGVATVNLVEWAPPSEEMVGKSSAREIAVSLTPANSKKAERDYRVKLILRVSAEKVASPVKSKDVVEAGEPARRMGQVFGRTLEEIVAMDKKKRRLPAIVTAITTEMRRRGLERQGLFRIAGSGRVTERIIYHFDYGMNELTDDEEEITVLAEYGPHEICDVLKKFLRQLPDPLMTFALMQDFLDIGEALLQSGDKPEEVTLPPEVGRKLATLVQQLPVSSLALLEHLIEFLEEVAQCEEQNMMGVQNLATVFGPTVLRSPDDVDPMKLLSDNPKKVILFACLMLHWDTLSLMDIATSELLQSAVTPLDALIDFIDEAGPVAESKLAQQRELEPTDSACSIGALPPPVEETTATPKPPASPGELTFIHEEAPPLPDLPSDDEKDSEGDSAVMVDDRAPLAEDAMETGDDKVLSYATEHKSVEPLLEVTPVAETREEEYSQITTSPVELKSVEEAHEDVAAVREEVALHEGANVEDELLARDEPAEDPAPSAVDELEEERLPESHETAQEDTILAELSSAREKESPEEAQSTPSAANDSVVEIPPKEEQFEEAAADCTCQASPVEQADPMACFSRREAGCEPVTKPVTSYNGTVEGANSSLADRVPEEPAAEKKAEPIIEEERQRCFSGGELPKQVEDDTPHEAEQTAELSSICQAPRQEDAVEESSLSEKDAGADQASSLVMLSPAKMKSKSPRKGKKARARELAAAVAAAEQQAAEETKTQLRELEARHNQEKKVLEGRLEQLKYRTERLMEQKEKMERHAREKAAKDSLGQFLVQEIYLSTRAWDEQHCRPVTATRLLAHLQPLLETLDSSQGRQDKKAAAAAIRQTLEAVRAAHKRTRDALEWNCYWLSVVASLLAAMQSGEGSFFTGDVKGEGLQLHRMAELSPLWQISPAASLLSSTHVEEQLQTLAVYLFVYLLDEALGPVLEKTGVLFEAQDVPGKSEALDPLQEALDSLLYDLRIHKLPMSVTRQVVFQLFSAISSHMLQRFREQPTLCSSKTGIDIKLNICSLQFWMEDHPETEHRLLLSHSLDALVPIQDAANLLVTCTNTSLFASAQELCDRFPSLAFEHVQFILHNYHPEDLTREERDEYDAATTKLILELASMIDTQASLSLPDESDFSLSESDNELVEDPALSASPARY